jgi:phosphatidyl-myo-inositol alpha-mannosyltransferase
MKVALLCENYYPTLGGIQEHVYHLAKGLRLLGVDAKVLTGLPTLDKGVWLGPRDEDWVVRVGKSRRYKIMGTSTTLTFGLGVALKLYRTLKSERFDLIHVHGPSDFGLPTILYALSSVPTIATLHSPMNGMAKWRRWVRPFYRWTISRHKSVIAVSEAARIAMSKLVDFESELIPNGVDVAAMSGGTPIAKYRDGRFNILMLGRLEPRNGPDIMFAALSEIVKLHPDVRLLVAGEEKPSGVAQHQAMVPETLRPHVVFLGPVFSERPDVYASADLCVLPARAGTFSIIVLEALAAGVPVVATPFIQACRTEPHWAPVTIADEISVEAFTRSLLDGIQEVKDGRAVDRIALGRQVVQRFDWSRVCKDVLEVYKRTLSKQIRSA